MLYNVPTRTLRPHKGQIGPPDANGAIRELMQIARRDEPASALRASICMDSVAATHQPNPAMVGAIIVVDFSSPSTSTRLQSCDAAGG